MSAGTFQEVLSWAIGDGPVLTAAARASCLPTANVYTLPNNFFTVGKKVRIRAMGRISCAVTTPGTARFDVAFDGTANGDSGALNLNIVAKTTVPWWLEIVGTCRTVGNAALGTIFWFGYFQSEAVIASPLPTVGGNGSLLFTHGGVGATAVGAGFDTTAAHAVDLRFTQTVATGSLTLQEYSLEAMN